jgi:dihydropteroate synthase
MGPAVSLRNKALWHARGRTIVGKDDPIPKVMGIVNLTPDSFSDGGRTLDLTESVARALALSADGADLLDLGGESSRPGSLRVDLDVEVGRVMPALRALVSQVAVPISIDTTKAEVARIALEAGASIINDISALAADPRMVDVVARSGAGVVLMHMQGVPETMHIDPRYNDVVAEVHEFLGSRVEWALSRGIPRERIAIDPGIGFGKKTEHNLQLLRNLHRFTDLGCVIVIGTSRKGFLGSITGRPLAERAAASVASSLAACQRGAQVVRVHDVAPMIDSIRVWNAVHAWEASP